MRLPSHRRPVRAYLPAIRIGRKVRIKPSDFDAVVEAGYSGGPRTPTEAVWGGEVPAPDVPAD